MKYAVFSGLIEFMVFVFIIIVIPVMSRLRGNDIRRVSRFDQSPFFRCSGLCGGEPVTVRRPEHHELVTCHGEFVCDLGFLIVVESSSPVSDILGCTGQFHFGFDLKRIAAHLVLA